MTINNMINIAGAPLSVIGGGTGDASFTAYAPVIGGSTSTGALASASSGMSTPGYVLTSTGSSSAPTWQAATGGGGITWANISGTSQTAAVNTAYIIENSSQTTVTLPVTAAQWSVVVVVGFGAAGWILKAGTGQTIIMGGSTTSSGGTLTSAFPNDSVQVVCVVANTTWSVYPNLTSGLTVA